MTPNNTHTALLVMDMQTQILNRLTDSAPLLRTTALAINKARRADIPIVYVALAFRNNFLEVSLQNKSFGAIQQSMGNINPYEKPLFPAEITPSADDVITIKKRVSAFTGSDLEVVLRSMHIRHLVLTGIATSGVVLSTLREAADKDFELTVLSDACADMDAEVHHVLLAKVFPRQADVKAVADWNTEAYR